MKRPAFTALEMGLYFYLGELLMDRIPFPSPPVLTGTPSQHVYAGIATALACIIGFRKVTRQPNCNAELHALKCAVFVFIVGCLVDRYLFGNTLTIFGEPFPQLRTALFAGFAYFLACEYPSVMQGNKS